MTTILRWLFREQELISAEIGSGGDSGTSTPAPSLLFLAIPFLRGDTFGHGKKRRGALALGDFWEALSFENSLGVLELDGHGFRSGGA